MKQKIIILRSPNLKLSHDPLGGPQALPGFESAAQVAADLRIEVDEAATP